jgi:magnesium chelatase subunit I
MELPGTIAELRASEYSCLPVKSEIKKNLMKKLQNSGHIFPGIIGYDDSVIPQIVNAILSGHNIILLGERGQAKSRILRQLQELLDEVVPAIKGCEINDNPFNPICKRCKNIVEEMGENTEIEWVERERRYGEKLATPDITIADILGEVDPIKVAEGRYLSDELTIHFGLIPRTNRGIFAINEIQDLPERVQVGLLNVMEEGDIQIRGYKIRLPLDIMIVASANPEDYTNRGRIITPLKDRFDVRIRTHYPKDRETEIKIMMAESRNKFSTGMNVFVPEFMRKIVGEITFQARRAPEINQRSGVSVRMSITNYETLLANAEKRSIINKEKEIVPRVSDLYSLIPSMFGKLEIEYTGKEENEVELFNKLINKSIKVVFDEYFNTDEFKTITDTFNNGAWMDVSDITPSEEYLSFYNEFPDLKSKFELLGMRESPGALASAIEFILEGLYLHNLLHKDKIEGKIHYRGGGFKRT